MSNSVERLKTVNFRVTEAEQAKIKIAATLDQSSAARFMRTTILARADAIIAGKTHDKEQQEFNI